MIWAIVSSAFVIYLYRELNTVSGSEAVDSSIPDNLIESELARLITQIDTLESIVRDKTRRIAP